VGFDDLLDDVRNAEGQFGDVGADIRLAFQARVGKLQDYHDVCRENIIYYISHALNPRIKLVNIREQCREQADEIINEIRQWLSRNTPLSSDSTRT
jgi:CRISPR/Cas system-associated exonuclease Cas4 (RecB family)